MSTARCMVDILPNTLIGCHPRVLHIEADIVRCGPAMNSVLARIILLALYSSPHRGLFLHLVNSVGLLKTKIRNDFHIDEQALGKYLFP